VLKKILKILSIVLLSLLGLLIVLTILVNINSVQNFLTRKVTNRLSAKLHTEVSIAHVDFQLFNKMVVEGILIKDQQKDTLLYAGKINVRITDFFFLKAHPVLHYVGLSNAVVHLNRPAHDSVWNYQFIIDSLTSRQSSGNGSIELDVRTVELHNVQLDQTDAWLGQDLHFGVREFLFQAQKTNFKKHIMQINSIIINYPEFSLHNYSGTRPSAADTASGSLPVTTSVTPNTLQWNPQNWKISIRKINIYNGIFSLDDPGSAITGPYFDAQHIHVSNIRASFDSTRVVKDSIFSNLMLAAKEQSGIEIREMKSKLKVSPVIMEFSQLDLQTNKSHIRNYYAMKFSNFNDMNDYINKVKMVADFKNSQVSSDDIAYFAPALSNWKMLINVNGKASGTVSDLTAQQMRINAGNSTYLQGTIQINGLPDISQTFIDFKADQLITNNKDLERLFPSIGKNLPIDINSLTKINFDGSFTGFLNDYVAYGNFNTNLGFVHSDVNMKVGEDHLIPKYSGSLSTKDMDLGALFDIGYLGKTSLEAKGSGQGVTLNTLKVQMDAGIDKLTFNGYPYENIVANGEFNGKLFDGKLEMRDPNADLNFDGTINYNDTVPHFNFNAEIFNSNLLALNITNDSVRFSGKLNLNFAGNNIDNFLGDARLYNINMYKDNDRIAFDSLHLHSAIDSGGEKLITLKGNEMSGYLKGHYNIHELPAAFKLFLNRYYPSLVSKPVNQVPDEDFNFAFNFGNVAQFLRAFTSQFDGLDNSSFTGSVNINQDKVAFTADVPSFTYNQYRFNNIHFNTNGTLQQLTANANIQGIYINDSLWFPHTQLIGSSARDTSYLSLQTDIPNALSDADIYSRIITLKSGYKINLLNASILMNDKEWKVSDGNEILIKNNMVQVKNFVFSQNEQQISVSTSADTTKNSFLVNLQNVNINDIAQLFHTSTQVEGIADGNITINNPIHDLVVNADLKATDFRLNNDSLGIVSLSGKFDKSTRQLPFTLNSLNLQASGNIDFNESANPIHGTINMDHETIQFLSPYLTDYVSNLNGYLTGKLDLSGTANKPVVTGTVKMDSMGVTVNYLQTHYTFNDEAVQLSDNKIDVGTMKLVDDKGNTATLTGDITHRNFNDINFDLHLATNKFHFLNTTYFDNTDYYGEAYGRGNIHFFGPINNMQMVVNIAPTEGTHMYLPISDSKDISKHDFIIFKTYGEQIKVPKRRRKDVNLTLRLFAEMNTNARIDVILDQTTGDAISAIGNGTINMNVSLNGNITMYGNYSIEEGTYTFTIQRLIPKNFQIDPGSTITWNGNPYDAIINVTAVYRVPGGASLYDLLAAEAGSGNDLFGPDLTRTQRVNVDLKLTGELIKPDINFSIDLPEEEVGGSYAFTRLQQLTQDPQQMITQVAGLLIFGQFLPETNTVSSSNLLVTGGLSSVGAILSAQGTTQLNNLVNRVLKNKNVGVSFNYNPYSMTYEPGDPLQRNALSVGINKSFLNNRIRVEVGPQWDWGRATATSGSSQYSYTTYFDPIGDFQLEYFVTPDGRIRLTAFRRSNYNVLLENESTIYGAGISYKRQFNYFMENFQSMKKEEQKQDSLLKKKTRKHTDQNDIHQLPVADSADTKPKVKVTIN
jgi:TamB, inner membrane protein subunit of TAM complex